MNPDQTSLRNEIRRLLAQWFSAASAPVDPHQLELAASTWGPDELMAALDVLLDGRITMGPRTEQFESAWAQRIGTAGACMVNSGSSANLLALAALASPDAPQGLRSGDEVLVPAVAWSTSVFPIAQVGCVPVLVDVDPSTFNIDPRALERAVTDRTRAVLVIHALGNPCDMDAVMAVARARKLWVIEDCCEAAGAELNGRPVGTFGDLSTFSFFFSHHLTTGEGGVVCFREPHWRDRLVSLRSHGWIRGRSDAARWAARHPDLDARWLFVSSGYNMRPMELQAAIGLVQLDRLKEFVARRRDIRNRFVTRLTASAPWCAPQRECPGAAHSAFAFGALLGDTAPASRDTLRRRLNAARIETRPIISGNFARQPAVHTLPYRIAGPLHGADRIHERGFMIGIHPGVTDAHVDHVIAQFESLSRLCA